MVFGIHIEFINMCNCIMTTLNHNSDIYLLEVKTKCSFKIIVGSHNVEVDGGDIPAGLGDQVAGVLHQQPYHLHEAAAGDHPRDVEGLVPQLRQVALRPRHQRGHGGAGSLPRGGHQLLQAGHRGRGEVREDVPSGAEQLQVPRCGGRAVTSQEEHEAAREQLQGGLHVGGAEAGELLTLLTHNTLLSLTSPAPPQPSWVTTWTPGRCGCRSAAKLKLD